jgi:hypothetical protein
MEKFINRHFLRHNKEKQMALLNIPLGEHKPERKPGFFTDFGMKLAVGLAAIAIGVVGVKAYYSDPYNRYQVCEYQIKAGDSLTSILQAEGLNGRALEEAVQAVCEENYDRMMPDGSFPIPVFEQNGTCDNMKRGIVSVPEYNGDGKINGQACKTIQ